MMCVPEIQTEQHKALSCLFPTYGINLRIYANKITEPRWRRLEPESTSLETIPSYPHKWKQAEILPLRGTGIEAVLAIVHGGFVKPPLKMEIPLKVFFPGMESCPPIHCDMQKNIHRLPKL